MRIGSKKPQKNDRRFGPKPERLKIDGDWRDAVKRALEKPPPEKVEGSKDDAEKERVNGADEG